MYPEYGTVGINGINKKHGSTELVHQLVHTRQNQIQNLKNRIKETNKNCGGMLYRSAM